MWLTYWGRVTHICVSELTIIGSDNGLSPGRRQAIIWNNAWLLLIESLGTNFSDISIGIQTFSFKKMHLNMSSAKWRLFCLGLNVLIKLNSLNFQLKSFYLCKCLLGCLNHFHILQVSVQLSCINTCQIWTWYSVPLFWENKWTEKIVLVTPMPGRYWYMYYIHIFFLIVITKIARALGRSNSSELVQETKSFQ